MYQAQSLKLTLPDDDIDSKETDRCSWCFIAFENVPESTCKYQMSHKEKKTYLQMPKNMIHPDTALRSNLPMFLSSHGKLVGVHESP